MPRALDHAQRRAEIAEAVWRVVVRDGASAVSVRTVAAEAGLAVGSLRHSFPAKDDLLAYAMELVHARAQARVRARADAPSEPLPRVRAMLLELIPLDEQRVAELRVHLALVGEAPAHPRLAELALRAARGVGETCLGGLAHLAEEGALHARRELAYEAARLHALLDGLALRILIDPGATAAEATAILDAHLAELRRAPAPAPARSA